MKTKERGIKPDSEIFFSTPSNQTLKLFYYVTCTGHFYYEDFYRLQRDSYNSFLIMHIVKGKAKIENLLGSYELTAGDTVFMDCHNPHGYEAISDLETIWFHFDGVNTKEIYNELREQYNDFVVLKNSFHIMDRINKIYMSYKNGRKVQEGVQSSYISRIIAEFFNIKVDNSDRLNLMEEILSYIDEHFKEELSVKTLAKKASLSEFYFSRLFKKETGYTIHEYIIKTRITNAKQMLQLTSLSLKEIAYSCGFTSESSFSTSFKKNTGVTPGAFRSTKF